MRTCEDGDTLQLITVWDDGRNRHDPACCQVFAALRQHGFSKKMPVGPAPVAIPSTANPVPGTSAAAESDAGSLKLLPARSPRGRTDRYRQDLGQDPRSRWRRNGERICPFPAYLDWPLNAARLALIVKTAGPKRCRTGLTFLQQWLSLQPICLFSVGPRSPRGKVGLR